MAMAAYGTEWLWIPEGLDGHGYLRGWMAMPTCGAGWPWPLRAMDGYGYLRGWMAMATWLWLPEG